MITTLMGLPFHCLSFSEAVASIIQLSKEGSGQLVVTANVDSVILTREVPDFLRAVHQASIVVADGMPIVWYARAIGLPLRERITGADLLPELCKAANTEGLRVMLFGGRHEVAATAASRLKEACPNLQIRWYAPPMGFEYDNAELRRGIAQVNEFEPHLLFVSLGQPRQELWALNNRHDLRYGVAIGIGAGIDFAAGSVRRAPSWMQSNGLEWLYRLTQEPGRLWKRYLVRDIRILAIMAEDLRHRLLRRSS